MKRWIIGLAAFALVAVVGTTQAQNVMEGQGALWSIRTGGVLNIESGGALQIAGSDRTAALATAPAAVAAGYKIARGTSTLDGSNPTDVSTGLTTIVACFANIITSVAPGVNTGTLTYTASGATLSIYGWKPTSSGNPTLIASTGNDAFSWFCVGT